MNDNNIRGYAKTVDAIIDGLKGIKREKQSVDRNFINKIINNLEVVYFDMQKYCRVNGLESVEKIKN